ncbi:MAG: hypothetical protein CVV02_18580 [Firmicutes bacterium HGW-Firmicutes-7]|nr:MAG: hypothetical protein CVV02_18580 [Firmicutes bacterium HGW-Firmicutes-7]
MKKGVVIILLSFIIMLVITPASFSETYEIKVADVTNIGNPAAESIIFFGKKVEQLTGGDIKVKALIGGVLGGEKETLEEVKIGTLQMTRTALAPLSTFNPNLSVFYLPFLFANREQVVSISGSGTPLEKALNAEIEKAGFKLIAWVAFGMRSIYSNKPIKNPEDLKGVKYRVTQADILVETINALGGIPSPIAWPEVYTALQMGVVSAADNDVVGYYTAKHFEVAKYFNETNQYANPCVLLMDLDYFNSLPSNFQEVIMLAGKQTEAYFSGLLLAKTEEYKKRIFDEYELGNIFIPNEEIDILAFRKQTEKVYEKYKCDLLDKILEYVK